jgi:DNA-binding XRE family transcriptional regulator
MTLAASRCAAAAIPPIEGRQIIAQMRNFFHYRGKFLSDAIQIAFGRVLRRLRKDAGLTQEMLGLEADLQRKYISLLEHGEKQASISTIFKVASALNIKVSKLMALVEHEIGLQ